MKIVHIIPGSGGSFYCGNCLRDSKYYSSIKKLGHDVLKVPMYLPLFSHDINNEDVPVFYGAVSLYLKQNYPFFKKAPKWVDSMLNTRPVLKQAARMAGSTRAKGLEEMTISMLLGEHGDQAEELEKMIRWMEEHYRPDVIHLSNALLLGLAGRLKSRLGVPVVCSLQDEDVWVDVMSEASREAVWKLMSEKAGDVAAFVSVSHYFTGLMKEKMSLDDTKVHTLHLGVDPGDYTFINSAEKERSIGFLSRMNECNGLDILVDAFILLKNDMKNHDVRLYVSGGHTGDDHQYIKKQKKKIIEAGVGNDVIFLENFENEHRHIFFERVSVLSVPVRNGEAFGIYLTEAMASGIPVVQPHLGAFPEIIESSGGGLICGENTPQKLAAALEKVLGDKKLLEEMSLKARNGVEEKFNINIQAAKLVDIYQEMTK
ncbi:MAG: glycosyltransferase [Marinilabiliales bacterium]|nr:MAG: glycosyltransferase [Marinilabiliales bacterium]